MAPRDTPGRLRIAHDVAGRGEQALLVTPGWVSHLEYDWATPEIRSYYQRLGGNRRRVIRYDKRGTGLSDRPTVGPAERAPTGSGTGRARRGGCCGALARHRAGSMMMRQMPLDSMRQLP